MDVIRRTELQATLHAYLNIQLDLAVSREVFDPSCMLLAKVDQDSYANDRRLDTEVIIYSDENSSLLLEVLRIFCCPVDVSRCTSIGEANLQRNPRSALSL